MIRLTATEVARNFSEILGRISRGEEVEVVRHGTPVALIVAPNEHLMSYERLLRLVTGAPSADEEFVGDLRQLRKDIGPPEESWPL